MGKKWNDAKPAEKLLGLYTMLLVANRPYSLTELSGMLCCSKPAVTRLIEQLEGSRFGKIQRFQQGREVLYQLEKPSRLPTVCLNAEGLYQLALCRELLTNLLPETMHKEMEISLRQAVAFLPQGSQELPDHIGTSISKGRIDYKPFQKMLSTILDAIRKHKVCEITYKGATTTKEKSFDFAPKRMIGFRESLLIQGYVVAAKGTVVPAYENHTTLALHRIKVCNATRRAACMPEIPEPGNTTFGVMQGEPFTAVVRFSAAAATYVAERQWSAHQVTEFFKDGSLNLQVQCQSTPEFLSWVLSFGKTAEVLSPEWLRAKVAQTVAETHAQYFEA
ncbi:helix-turn-helix transcriptional regulator [Desulfovibrio sp. QI0430]